MLANVVDVTFPVCGVERGRRVTQVSDATT